MSETTTTEAVGQLWQARIQVTLKPVVLDPQGDAVLHGLHQLGFSDVAARAGRQISGTHALRRDPGRRRGDGAPDVRPPLGKSGD